MNKAGESHHEFYIEKCHRSCSEKIHRFTHSSWGEWHMKHTIVLKCAHIWCAWHFSFVCAHHVECLIEALTTAGVPQPASEMEEEMILVWMKNDHIHASCACHCQFRKGFTCQRFPWELNMRFKLRTCLRLHPHGVWEMYFPARVDKCSSCHLDSVLKIALGPWQCGLWVGLAALSTILS